MRIQLALLSACLLATGCAWGGNRLAMDSVVSSGGYQTARIDYSIDAAALGVPVAVSRVGARQVAYEEVPSDLLRGRSVGTLQIIYPHPAKREGMALLGVVIQQRRDPGRGMIPRWGKLWRDTLGRDEVFLRGVDKQMHEAWVLDVPKAELDAILAQVAQQQSQAAKPRSGPHDGVRMTAAVDGNRWTLEDESLPALDALMQRVRSSGQLISYRGAAQPSANLWRRPASLVAYEQNQSPETADPFAKQSLARLPRSGRSMR